MLREQKEDVDDTAILKLFVDACKWHFFAAQNVFCCLWESTPISSAGTPHPYWTSLIELNLRCAQPLPGHEQATAQARIHRAASGNPRRRVFAGRALQGTW